jgi:RNA polymerase sigma factor for flagellar operon FliA
MSELQLSPPVPAPYGVAALGALASRMGASAGVSTADASGDPQASESLLWERLRDMGDAQAREQLVLMYLPYARSLAAVLYRQHVPYEVEFRDYVQWATLGLIEALDRYDPQRGAKFSTYAYTRIQGAIRNGLEHISERQEQLSLHRRLIAERAQAMACMHDLSDAGTPAQVLLGEMAEIGTALILGFMLDDTGMVLGPAQRLPDGCYEALAFKQEQQRVLDLLAQLTPREESVIRLHYLQSMTFEDVARTLGITKGRVSQLHQQALTRLRGLLIPTTS